MKKTSSDGKILAVQDIFSQVHSSKSVWSLDQTLRLLASVWYPIPTAECVLRGLAKGRFGLEWHVFFSFRKEP